VSGSLPLEGLKGLEAIEIYDGDLLQVFNKST